MKNQSNAIKSFNTAAEAYYKAQADFHAASKAIADPLIETLSLINKTVTDYIEASMTDRDKELREVSFFLPKQLRWMMDWGTPVTEPGIQVLAFDDEKIEIIINPEHGHIEYPRSFIETWEATIPTAVLSMTEGDIVEMIDAHMSVVRERLQG